MKINYLNKQKEEGQDLINNQNNMKTKLIHQLIRMIARLIIRASKINLTQLIAIEAKKEKASNKEKKSKKWLSVLNISH